ncbi:hypothetical protein OM416_16470 [Paenibacillus sp. LS1]|uniref:hypothetical protein n=1 Tax=Paenibacillus sp. LS1 TaxID=2992120 RepID=UPI0022303054|nr:hypothetical protein [Paenibacillus sp. LS1]MCW3793186.1 hypothetical protein [Paenibacillus sp. LS1]
MNSYILSFIKKMSYFFEHKKISNIIYLHDEDNYERLDHVIFLETEDGDFIGIYIRGMNPHFSSNRIYDLDDFNLFANYERLIEHKENIIFKIEYVCLFFSSEYNELLGFYLSNKDISSSLFVLFSQDEIDVKKNYSKSDVIEIIKNKYSSEGFITYEKKSESGWEDLKIE